jgi:hypothetical protein
MPADEISFQATKIGMLDKRNGERTYMNTEFVYIEAEPRPGRIVKLGFVAIGIAPVETALDSVTLTKMLGLELYTAATS